MQRLYDVRSTLLEELCSYGDMDRIDMTSLHVIDTLAHSIKNIDRIIETSETYKKSTPRHDHVGRRNDYIVRHKEVNSDLQEMIEALPEDKQHEVKTFVESLK